MSESRDRADLLDWMLREQIPLPEEPETLRPSKLPTDVTLIGEQELMELFREYVQWQEWFATLHVFAVAQAEEAADALAEVEGAFIEKAKGQITTVKAIMAADPKRAEAKAAVRRYENQRRMTRTLAENAESISSFLSRELTRRGHNAPYERRTRKGFG